MLLLQNSVTNIKPKMIQKHTCPLLPNPSPKNILGGKLKKQIDSTDNIQYMLNGSYYQPFNMSFCVTGNTSNIRNWLWLFSMLLWC